MPGAGGGMGWGYEDQGVLGWADLTLQWMPAAELLEKTEIGSV